MSSTSFGKFINIRNVAVIAIIVGLLVGYQANDLIVSPRITSLEDQLNTKTVEVTVAALQANVTKIMSDLRDVTDAYNSLKDNSVPKTDYNELNQKYEAKSQSLTEAEARIVELETLGGQLLTEKNTLSASYQDLLAKYNSIRLLPWTYFVVNGLEVNLTVSTSNYDGNSPIEGTMKINYVEDGKPFKGSYTLTLWSDFYGTGNPSGTYTINGASSFVFSYPFTSGPGKYSLKVSSIKDTSGADMASFEQLLQFKIQLIRD
jgi:hypothetical protein